MPTDRINKQQICQLRVGHCSTPNRYICWTQQIAYQCAVFNKFLLFLLFRDQQCKITTDRQILWVNLLQNPLDFANFVSLNAPLLIQRCNKFHSIFMSIERQHSIIRKALSQQNNNRFLQKFNYISLGLLLCEALLAWRVTSMASDYSCNNVRGERQQISQEQSGQLWLMTLYFYRFSGT